MTLVNISMSNIVYDFTYRLDYCDQQDAGMYKIYTVNNIPILTKCKLRYISCFKILGYNYVKVNYYIVREKTNFVIHNSRLIHD